MDAFAALADPTRRRVLDLLRTRERAAGEIVEAFPKHSQPAISKHLRVLREAGLVNVRASEQRRVYSLRPEGLAEIEAWIAPYRAFWSAQLDALERHLDARAEARRAQSATTTTTGKTAGKTTATGATAGRPRTLRRKNPR